MKQSVFIMVYEHADLVWRRCFDRDFEYKGHNFVSYSDLEGYYIIENVKLCDKYDFYCFTIESVAMLRKFLEKNPEYENKIYDLVKSKKVFIPFSGDNIIDSNMADGESIVRNFLYGHYYLKNKYGIEPQFVTRNDAFGNSAQLPQIIRKFGRKWVGSITYSYSDNLYWRGLDGSTVLNYEPKIVGYAGGYYKYPPCPACNGFKDDDCLMCKNMRIDLPFLEKMRVKITDPLEHDGSIPGYIYCGGEEILPTEDIVKWTFENKDKYNFTFIGFDDYLPYINRLLNNLDTPDDDRIHSSPEINANNTGCYVTRIKTKQTARQNENAILSAETLNTVLFAKTGVYPYKEFSDIWENMLFTLFHDAITATHIDAAYDEIMDCTKKINNKAKQLQLNAIMGIRQSDKNTIVVYNPFGSEISSDVSVLINATNDVCLLDENMQPVSISDYKNTEAGIEITFYVKDIEAYTQKNYTIVEKEYIKDTEVLYKINNFNGKPVLTNSVGGASVKSQSEQTVIENENFKITAENDGIKEIFDKNLGMVISTSGEYNVGEWILEHDEGSPWSTHSTDMRRKRLGTSTNLIQIEKTRDIQKLTFYILPEELDGYSVMGFNVTYSVILQKSSDKIKFEADVKWDTQNHRLRIAFPTIGASRHFYEIPYGVIERKPYKNTIINPNGTSNWASANGDYPAINWAGIQNKDYSLALFNKGTPSYLIDDDSVIYLSVLRSPAVASYLNSPTEYSMTDYDGMRDCGKHHFEYAIKAYKKGFDENTAVLDGVSYNAQLFTADGLMSIDTLPTLECADARITSIKPSQSGKGLIIRINEFHGKNTKGIITIPDNICFSAAYTTDLKEESMEPLVIENNTIAIDISRFEIKTIFLIIS